MRRRERRTGLGDLVITHAAAALPPAPLQFSDWNLQWTRYDDNGFPLGPDWASHVQSQRQPSPGGCRWPWYTVSASTFPCTTQTVTQDSYTICQTFSADYGFGGHLNWMAATYTGHAHWQSKAIPTQDDDYSLDLHTDQKEGGAPGSTYGVHIEFDSDETVDPMTRDFKVPVWQKLRTAVDQSEDTVHALIEQADGNGTYTIASGLIGIDFAHTPGTESHPVWAVAMDLFPDPVDDTWAIFVRNWGDEGYCSGDQHYVQYHHPVEPLGDADREALDRAGERAAVGRLDQQMDVVALDREPDDADVEAITTDPERRLDDAERAPAAQVVDVRAMRTVTWSGIGRVHSPRER